MITTNEGVILPGEVVINAKWFSATPKDTAMERIAEMVEISLRPELIRFRQMGLSFERIEDFLRTVRAAEEWEKICANREARLPADEWYEIKRLVHARDGYKCTACESRRSLECHHVVALAEGGSNQPENLTTLCHECHKKETAALMKRLSDPFGPITNGP